MSQPGHVVQTQEGHDITPALNLIYGQDNHGIIREKHPVWLHEADKLSTGELVQKSVLSGIGDGLVGLLIGATALVGANYAEQFPEAPNYIKSTAEAILANGKIVLEVPTMLGVFYGATKRSACLLWSSYKRWRMESEPVPPEISSGHMS